MKYEIAESRIAPNKTMAMMVRIVRVGGQERLSSRDELRADCNRRFRVHVRSEVGESVAVVIVIVVGASDVKASAMDKDNV